MKAITTRYIGATEHRPARIIASDQDRNRITLKVDADTHFPYTDLHHGAAVKLCQSMQWAGAETLIGGSVKHGMVWVFGPAPAAAEEAPRQLLQRTLPMLVRLGNYIGNGSVDAARPGSLGTRCDLIGDIHTYLEGPAAAEEDEP
jgi:hypothetical protein